MTLAPIHWLGSLPAGDPAPAPLPTPPENVQIPVSALPPLTAEQSDPGGGDIRAVVHGLLRQLEAFYQSLDPEDKPATFYIGCVDNRLDATKVVRTYTVNIHLATPPSNVAPEPSLP